MVEVIKVFDIFSSFSGFKPNKSKCEVAQIETLKGEKMALCGIKCIGLRFNIVKNLGIHFSYNKKNENDEKFLEQIISIEKVLKLCHMQNLTLDGQVTVFEALAISKIVHLALISQLISQHQL